MTNSLRQNRISNAWMAAVISTIAFLLLPFGRPNRKFLEIDDALRPWNLDPSLSWLVWLVLVAAITAIVISFLPIKTVLKGNLLSLTGLLGLLAGVIWLVVTKTPFGMGALISLILLINVIGYGLSESGRIQSDAFVASSIIFVSLFIILFILYPLYTVLINAIIVDGQFTLSKAIKVLSGQRFIFIDNPYTPRNEPLLIGIFSIIGALTVSSINAFRKLEYKWFLFFAAIGVNIGLTIIGGLGDIQRNQIGIALIGKESLYPLVGIFGLIGALVLTSFAVLQKLQFTRFLLYSLIGAAIGFVVGFSAFARGALPTSIGLAAIVATTVTLLGLFLAILGQRTRFSIVKKSLASISLLPIITPPFVLAFAMIFLFGRQGMVTKQILGLRTNELFGLIGVAGAQILAFTPIAYLVIRGSVASLDPALEEASVTLGAGRWTTFRTITWPLLRPALANAFLLTLIESFADFGNPLILGGDRFYLSTEVFSAYSARFDQNEAAVLGLVLLVIVLSIFFAQRRWLGGDSFVTVTGKPSSGKFVELPRAFEAFLLFLFTIWTVLVLSLYGSIIYGSFVKIWGINNTLTLQNYKDFMNQGWPVFLYTAKVAAISAVPAAFLGFLIAYLVVRQKFWGRNFVELGSMLSFAIPGTVMGIAYILAFNNGPWLLTSSMVILVLAFIFRNMPVAIRGGIAGLAQIDPSLEEASTTLRANSSTTLRRILVPLLIVPLIGGLIFAFVRAMTAISQVIFLISSGNKLATTLLLGWVEQGQLGRASAMATIMIFSMLAVISLLMLFTRGRGARGIG